MLFSSNTPLPPQTVRLPEPGPVNVSNSKLWATGGIGLLGGIVVWTAIVITSHDSVLASLFALMAAGFVIIVAYSAFMSKPLKARTTAWETQTSSYLEGARRSMSLRRFTLLSAVLPDDDHITLTLCDQSMKVVQWTLHRDAVRRVQSDQIYARFEPYPAGLVIKALRPRVASFTPVGPVTTWIMLGWIPAATIGVPDPETPSTWVSKDTRVATGGAV